MDSTASPKMKIMEGEGIGACSPAHNTSEVEGCAGASGWGLRKLTSKSIIHMNMHKPNNKLVSVQLEQLWCMHEPLQTHIHKTHQDLNLGEATAFPIIVYSIPGHGANTQMSFCPETPKWES
jgi:hypothetical protein